MLTDSRLNRAADYLKKAVVAPAALLGTGCALPPTSQSNEDFYHPLPNESSNTLHLEGRASRNFEKLSPIEFKKTAESYIEGDTLYINARNVPATDISPSVKIANGISNELDNITVEETGENSLETVTLPSYKKFQFVDEPVTGQEDSTYREPPILNPKVKPIELYNRNIKPIVVGLLSLGALGTIAFGVLAGRRRRKAIHAKKVNAAGKAAAPLANKLGNTTFDRELEAPDLIAVGPKVKPSPISLLAAPLNAPARIIDVGAQTPIASALNQLSLKIQPLITSPVPKTDESQILLVQEESLGTPVSKQDEKNKLALLAKRASLLDQNEAETGEYITSQQPEICDFRGEQRSARSEEDGPRVLSEESVQKRLSTNVEMDGKTLCEKLKELPWDAWTDEEQKLMLDCIDKANKSIEDGSFLKSYSERRKKKQEQAKLEGVPIVELKFTKLTFLRHPEEDMKNPVDHKGKAVLDPKKQKHYQNMTIKRLLRNPKVREAFEKLNDGESRLKLPRQAQSS